jgi:hypothetical protein
MRIATAVTEMEQLYITQTNPQGIEQFYTGLGLERL